VAVQNRNGANSNRYESLKLFESDYWNNRMDARIVALHVSRGDHGFKLQH